MNSRVQRSQLYASRCAVSLVCQAVSHISMSRVLFCRDLLILQKLYLHFGDNVGQRRSTNVCFATRRLACLCFSGLSGRRLSAVAAPAGPGSPELTHAHLLSPPEAREPEPGVLCPRGRHVSTPELLRAAVAVRW